MLGVVEARNALSPEYEPIGLLDDGPAIEDATFRRRGVRRIGCINDLAGHDTQWVVGIGYPKSREMVAVRAHTLSNRTPERLVHPLCDRSSDVEIGAGAVILGASRLSAGVRVGAHVLVSYHSAVGHGSEVEDFTSIMPGCLVSGDVRVGRGVLLGTGAVILEGLHIGDEAVVAAGAVVTADVGVRQRVGGIPARPL